MSVNLMDLFKNFASQEIVSKISEAIGEKPEATKTALGFAAPTILAGLAQKATSSQGASAIFDMIKGGNFESMIGNVSNLFGSNTATTGSNLIQNIFGQTGSSVMDFIANKAGIGKTSSSKLFSFAAPMVMGLIGKHMSSSGITSASGLASLLTSQSGFIQNLLPAGLGNVMGLASNFGNMSMPSTEGFKKWIPWAAAALLALGGFYMIKNKSNMPAQIAQEGAQMATDAANTATDAASQVTETASEAVKAATDTVSGLGEFFKKALTNGVELNIPQNGVENKLIGFIDDATKAADKTTWFTFDRITFETGSSKITEKSNEQLQNIVEILKAYPNVELKIGGYTDNVGDAAANLKLSQARAEAVMSKLVALGATGTRLKAEGYGIEHPVADNTTEEGRAKNRRIDVRVSKK